MVLRSDRLSTHRLGLSIGNIHIARRNVRKRRGKRQTYPKRSSADTRQVAASTGDNRYSDNNRIPRTDRTRIWIRSRRVHRHGRAVGSDVGIPLRLYGLRIYRQHRLNFAEQGFGIPIAVVYRSCECERLRKSGVVLRSDRLSTHRLGLSIGNIHIARRNVRKRRGKRQTYPKRSSADTRQVAASTGDNRYSDNNRIPRTDRTRIWIRSRRVHRHGRAVGSDVGIPLRLYGLRIYRQNKSNGFAHHIAFGHRLIVIHIIIRRRNEHDILGNSIMIFRSNRQRINQGDNRIQFI